MFYATCYMKILFLNYEYPPLGGGAGNATSYLLKEFAKISDLEVELITSSIDKQYHLEKVGENILIHRLPIGKNQKNLHFQSQKDLIIYFCKAYWFSQKILKESTSPHQCHDKNNDSNNIKQNNNTNGLHWCRGKFDMTLAFFSVPCGFLAWILKKQFKVPYVVSLRGADVPGFSERFTWLYKIISPLIKKIWKESACVIAASQGLKDLALKTSPLQKMEIIPNGIDTRQFRPSLIQIEVRPRLEVGPRLNRLDIFQILCVTRITPRKNIRYLIEAVNQLCKKYTNLNLQIVGEGDEKGNLEKLAKELGIEKQINFAGLIPHEKLPAYYQSACVYVLPSQNEGMSNSMLEALSSGLPLLATDTGGTKELVEDGVNGFIIKMKNSEDIAEKLEILIKDEELRKKMGQKSREKAEGMNWESVAQKYVSMINDVSS